MFFQLSARRAQNLERKTLDAQERQLQGPFSGGKEKIKVSDKEWVPRLALAHDPTTLHLGEGLGELVSMSARVSIHSPQQLKLQSTHHDDGIPHLVTVITRQTMAPNTAPQRRQFVHPSANHAKKK